MILLWVKMFDQGKDFMFNHMFYSDNEQKCSNYVFNAHLGKLVNHLLELS